MAARGDGATADGRFVQGAAVGDHVRFEPGGVVIVPGPLHATPVCRHVPECGGCQLQHVTDSAYADFVVDRIVRALAHSGVAVGTLAPVAMSPPRSRRRASLRAVKRGGTLTLGFNAEASHRIVDIVQCEVLAPELFQLVAPLRMLLGKALADGQGAGVTLTMSDSGIDVLLANVAADTVKQIERLTGFAAAHDLARLSVEGPQGVETVALARMPVLALGGVPVALPPAPFLQATREGEAALVAAVAEAVGGARRVADLFCGLGTFALPLSAKARIMAADAAGPAVAALEATARQFRRPVETAHRDLFRRPLTAVELGGFDAVVFDPPRAGAEAQSQMLATSKVPVVVAVSCNPSTFARDAAILVKGGYRLEHLWPVAQFRWSTHVELVAVFRR
ncbi:methyltransferase [Polymorphobacter fuscus]|uniref:Methyltransferase n=1 Tax=Sandarakinorhabdus fusca TaxID=1439888 RepID=A0A7C9GNJ0_9SPHN|nr:methyltransferase [Polymorphobacter fuscus]KAB7649054.1 class I SAM-dependent RNA methyltransferase [Polymorphobacter fuscus]MQT16010.1 methyltransferase [Polymorphobacter fuscus]